MKAIINGKVILPDGVYGDSVVLFDDKIEGVVPSACFDPSGVSEITDAKGNYVSPGLVDIHIHGYNGFESVDDPENSIRGMAEGIIKNGVTSFLPTTMTVAMADIEKTLDTARNQKSESKSWNGAEIIGVNVEGPFINPAKKGAQDEKYILKPDASFVKKYEDIIKIITIAPEMDEDFKCISEVTRDTGVLVSMGHTAANFDTAMAGVRHGVGHATHLFNAMTPLMHRDPGVVGAALATDVTVEVIADTFHINKALYDIVYKVKGDKMILITDCIRAGGLSDGVYTLGGLRTTVKGIQCRLDDGTIAGSMLRLNLAVSNVMKNTSVIPLHKIVNAASLCPAKAAKVDDRKGSLEKGKDADILIADSDFGVVKVFKGGKCVVGQ